MYAEIPIRKWKITNWYGPPLYNPSSRVAASHIG